MHSFLSMEVFQKKEKLDSKQINAIYKQNVILNCDKTSSFQIIDSLQVQQQTGKLKMFLEVYFDFPVGQTPAAPGFQNAASIVAQSRIDPRNRQVGH